MNEYIEERLQNLIIKILANQASRLPIKHFLNDAKRSFVSVSNEILREAIDHFEEQQLYKTKSFNYFKAIVRNKVKDAEEKKRKNNQRLGHLPTNII